MMFKFTVPVELTGVESFLLWTVKAVIKYLNSKFLIITTMNKYFNSHALYESQVL